MILTIIEYDMIANIQCKSYDNYFDNNNELI